MRKTAGMAIEVTEENFDKLGILWYGEPLDEKFRPGKETWILMIPVVGRNRSRQMYRKSEFLKEFYFPFSSTQVIETLEVVIRK